MLSLHEHNFLLKKEVQVKIINARAATALSTMEQLLLHIYSPAADFFAAAFAMMFVDERFFVALNFFGAPVGGWCWWFAVALDWGTFFCPRAKMPSSTCDVTEVCPSHTPNKKHTTYLPNPTTLPPTYVSSLPLGRA